MAKLPDNFVKAPSAPKMLRRPRKTVEVDGVLLRLSPDELAALTAACEALAAVDEPVSIEDMIHQVIGRWMAATRAMATAEEAPPAPASAHEPVAARCWRAVGDLLRRWTRRHHDVT